jgi:hypothetical protein
MQVLEIGTSISEEINYKQRFLLSSQIHYAAWRMTTKFDDVANAFAGSLARQGLPRHAAAEASASVVESPERM